MSNAPPDRRRGVRVRIEGRVQGVGYRYWAEGAATALGLAGWVRNRRDGTVEALFAGPAGDVAQMLDRCHDGPPGSNVTVVTVLEEGIDPPAGFDVLATA
jgi:acylphosphatase